MGLDTTHDCWHGPYSSFMRWRQFLNREIMQARRVGSPLHAEIADMGESDEAIMKAWDEGVYEDQADPLNVLMMHSDCDGEIAAEMCGPMADALQEIVDRMPERALYDMHRPATGRFIAGLRKASAAGEAVEFH